jgi:ubiquinone/menaquinone biosynthesis C-methylase UbiE
MPQLRLSKKFKFLKYSKNLIVQSIVNNELHFGNFGKFFKSGIFGQFRWATFCQEDVTVMALDEGLRGETGTMRTHHISLLESPTGYQFSLAPKVDEMVELLKAHQVVSVLDVSCGIGQHSRYLIHHAFMVYALDIHYDILASLTPSVTPTHPGYLCLVTANFTRLPFQTACMDTIWCLSTIHHSRFPGIVMALQEFTRILCPGGFLCLDILSRNDPSYGQGTPLEPHMFIGSRIGEEDIPHHYTTQEEITQILSAFIMHSLEEV